MDLNDIRIAVTLASLLLFVALVLHTFNRRRSTEHEAAAALPFADDGADPVPGGAGQQGERRE